MIWKALRIYVILTLLTGLLYPGCVTGVAGSLFPKQSLGSLVRHGRQVVGSELLAQDFSGPRYFWPRPSTASYATVPSGASNLGPTSAVLRDAVRARAEELCAAHGLPAGALVPPALIFASGSGLDPHLSPAAVRFQAERVAQARGFSDVQRRNLADLIAHMVEPPQFGFLGEPRINVLLLNRALDELQ